MFMLRSYREVFPLTKKLYVLHNSINITSIVDTCTTHAGNRSCDIRKVRVNSYRLPVEITCTPCNVVHVGAPFLKYCAVVHNNYNHTTE